MVPPSILRQQHHDDVYNDRLFIGCDLLDILLWTGAQCLDDRYMTYVETTIVFTYNSTKTAAEETIRLCSGALFARVSIKRLLLRQNL